MAKTRQSMRQGLGDVDFHINFLETQVNMYHRVCIIGNFITHILYV